MGITLFFLDLIFLLVRQFIKHHEMFVRHIELTIILILLVYPIIIYLELIIYQHVILKNI